MVQNTKTAGAVVIEEVDNKGIVSIFSSNKEAMDAAIGRIKPS